MTSVHELPAGLPVPVDDGAADHLLGLAAPDLTLESSDGPFDLAAFAGGLGVLYVYPATGILGRPTPDGWDAIPGARGCTPQSCAFRDHAGDLDRLGAHVAGLSAQDLAEQRELAARERIPFPVVADPGRALGAALRLPTFEFGGRELYRRVTLVFETGAIVKVFYPVFPPDRNAADVVAWLRERRPA